MHSCTPGLRTNPTLVGTDFRAPLIFGVYSLCAISSDTYKCNFRPKYSSKYSIGGRLPPLPSTKSRYLTPSSLFIRSPANPSWNRSFEYTVAL